MSNTPKVVRLSYIAPNDYAKIRFFLKLDLIITKKKSITHINNLKIRYKYPISTITVFCWIMSCNDI